MRVAPGWFPGTYWEILLQAPVEGASSSRPKIRNPPGGWHLSPPTGAPETRCLSQPGPAGPSVMPGRRGGPALAGRCSSGYSTEYSMRQKALGQTDGQSETALDSFPGPSANEQSLLLAPPGGRRGGADSPGRWGVQLGLGPAARGWGLHAPSPPAASSSGALGSRGWELRGVSVEGGGGGEGALPAPGPGWERRKRGLGAPACGRAGPREAEGGAGLEPPRALRGAAHQPTLPPCPPHHAQSRGSRPELQRAGTIPRVS